MPNQLGGDTRDLRALGHPHPAETGLPPGDTDTAARQHGRRCRGTGLAIIAGTAVSTLVAFIVAVTGEHTPFDDPAAVLFAALGIITTALSGAILLAVGLHERNQQNQRAMARLAVTWIKDNAERLEAVMELVAPLPGRLAAIETIVANLPDYGRGVIDGVQMRQAAANPDIDRLS